MCLRSDSSYTLLQNRFRLNHVQSRVFIAAWELFRVSGFRFRVSGFGFRSSGFIDQSTFPPTPRTSAGGLLAFDVVPL